MGDFEAFLDSYGIAAACAVMLIKAAGVPIPIPGDVILLAVAARAGEGKLLLWVAFIALLAALILGGVAQFLLARGPARRLVVRYGPRLGLNETRLNRVAASVRRGGLLGIGLGVLTPGVRSAIIPACGLTGTPMRVFLPGLALGTTVDLTLHFAIGYAGSSLLTTIVQPAPLLALAMLAVLGLGAWLVVARRKHLSRGAAVNAWMQATCPVCLVVGTVAPGEAETAIRWQRAV
jgi:membrane protein DedA with SNARE-associated domain